MIQSRTLTRTQPCQNTFPSIYGSMILTWGEPVCPAGAGGAVSVGDWDVRVQPEAHLEVKERGKVGVPWIADRGLEVGFRGCFEGWDFGLVWGLGHFWRGGFVILGTFSHYPSPNLHRMMALRLATLKP